MASKTPSYRQRSGYTQAIVTLTDAQTRKRRDYWLGEYDSPESREQYHRLIAEWEASGRRLPQSDPASPPGVSSGGITITELIHAFWRWAEPTQSANDIYKMKATLRLLRRMFGTTSALEFGPKRLRLLRDEMIRGEPDAKPPRKPWSRRYINRQVQRLCAMFKWAAGQELLPATVFQQLKMVEALRRGRSAAVEKEPVRPVAGDLVDAIRPFVSRQVWALIELQRLTGARGGELFPLRPIDLQMDEKTGVWSYMPADHKTQHLGKGRVIYFGPRAQEIIRPFLAIREVDVPLFSPAEAEAERLTARHAARKTPMSCGNRPGTNRTESPSKKPGDRFTACSYLKAITCGCDRAFTPPAHLRPGPRKEGRGTESRREFLAKLSSERREELKAWRTSHRWHPHQLRHAAATHLRRTFGLEAAQLVLGHSSALVTDAVYAERDNAKVVEVMKKIG